MAELINFNKARKARTRQADKARAAVNRAKFGRPKAETLASKLEAERAGRDLDGKKRDGDGPGDPNR